MAGALTLDDTNGSPCARRVRIVLLEKGLSWTTRPVDLTKMEQKRPEYLQLNSNGVRTCTAGWPTTSSDHHSSAVRPSGPTDTSCASLDCPALPDN